MVFYCRWYVIFITQYLFKCNHWTFHFWTATIRITTKIIKHCQINVSDESGVPLAPLTGHFTFKVLQNMQEAVLYCRNIITGMFFQWSPCCHFQWESRGRRQNGGGTENTTACQVVLAALTMQNKKWFCSCSVSLTNHRWFCSQSSTLAFMLFCVCSIFVLFFMLPLCA